jgi:hypothetical protein
MIIREGLGYSVIVLLLYTDRFGCTFLLSCLFFRIVSGMGLLGGGALVSKKLLYWGQWVTVSWRRSNLPADSVGKPSIVVVRVQVPPRASTFLKHADFIFEFFASNLALAQSKRPRALSDSHHSISTHSLCQLFDQMVSLTLEE